MKKRETYHVKVYLIEEYWVEAADRDGAISIVNMDGNPAKVETVKQVAKKVKPKNITK